MVKSNKNAITAGIALIVCLFLLSVFTTAVQAAAQTQSVKAELLKPRTDTAYFYMDEPYSLFADDSNLYVTTLNRSVYVFTHEGNLVDTLTLAGNAEKILSCGKSLFSLQDGALTDENGTVLASGVRDIAAGENTLYAIAAQSLTRYAVTEDIADVASAQTVSLAFTPIAVAAASDAVYLVADASKNTYRSDIYRYDLANGSVKRVFERAVSVQNATASPLDDNLITLEAGKLICYENKNGMLKVVAQTAVSDVRAVSACSRGAFALTGDGGILRYDNRFSQHAEIVVSASAQSGFFSAQKNISTRKSSLFVSDYGNNRVAKISGESCDYIPFDFIMPTASAVDNLGNIYVSHNMDAIEVFDAAFTHRDTLLIEGENIQDLLFDSKNNLYVRTDDAKLYRIDAQQTKAELFYAGGADALSIAPDNVVPYVLNRTARAVYALTSGTQSKVFEYNCDAVDFAVDIKKNFYLLTASGSIYKYASADNYAEDISAPTDYEPGYAVGSGSNKIVLSTVKNETLRYGDILINDPVRHCVRRIDGAAFGVEVMDDSFVPPVIDGDDKPNDIIDDPTNPDYRIIRTALSDVDLYEKPIEMSPFYTIAKGRKIIVADYDIAESDAFSFVLVEDLTSSPARLVSGYVYKVLLSDALPYEAPVAAQATTYSDFTPVYKWPSRHAEMIKNFNEVKKGTKFSLLEFVKDYADMYAVKWYRINVDGLGEGYVQAVDLSVRNYEPVFIRPQTNAVILSVNGSTGAPLYNRTDAGYEMSDGDQPLLTGTRVEVVGAFDQSQKYTQVKFFDESLGTLTGYVETVYLQYDGVSVLLIVTIIIISLTVIGLTLVLVWRYAAKRRQITKA